MQLAIDLTQLAMIIALAVVVILQNKELKSIKDRTAKVEDKTKDLIADGD